MFPFNIGLLEYGSQMEANNGSVKDAIALSQVISLKRIADALSTTAETQYLAAQSKSELKIALAKEAAEVLRLKAKLREIKDRSGRGTYAHEIAELALREHVL